MSTNAFDVLMRKATPVDPPDDPWYTAVIYEAHLEHVDPEEPMFRVPYFGQVVRPGTAEENFEARKRHHERDTIRDPKDIGFHSVIGMFGADKIAWRIVSSKSGRRSEVQAWADAEEKRLIAEHGGPLRDMDAKLKQTLNLTKGGKGDGAAVWAGIEARRRRALTKFKAAMEAYVEEHGSALVPKAYVDDDGYPLGQELSDFRRGRMRRGMPDKANIDAWAEALPKWAWNARKTDEFRQGLVQRSTEQAARKEAADPGYHSRRCKDQMTNMTAKQKTDRLNKRKATMDTAESKAKRSKSSKEWWINATEEQKADFLVKRKATMATAESKAKRSKIARDQRATERRAELERARPIAVPFVKSQKRRAELRAASTDFSGKRGNAVLYMISEDGKTIRRVNTEGCMGNVQIVGPVVDPAPLDAFDSDSDWVL